MKHAKRISALICVFAICFTLMCAPSAHAVGALGGQAAGAWIAAGLVALNIVAHTGAQAIGSYFGWQSAPTSQSVMEYAFPNATSVISDYMNAATIKVDQGVTTIDGVVYDELWVSPDTFTNGLKTNLFDFKTKWAILSGQAGTLATGAGSIAGIPVYNINNVIKSPKFVSPVPGSYQEGDISVITSRDSYTRFKAYLDGALKVEKYKAYGATQSWTWYIQAFIKSDGEWNTMLVVDNTSVSGSYPYDKTGFQYDYVSGIVPAQESDIPDNYGLSLQIPHDQLQTFYNLYPQYNVDNSVINIQQDQIDIDQLTQSIFDQLTAMDEIRAEWKAEEEPEPPGPVPPGPAEDVLEGVNIIIEQQNTQIEQNQAFMQSEQQQIQNQQQQIQNQQQQIQQQQQIHENTSDIKEAIENATQTPSSEDLPDFKFDLRELFPFCIPFDIYRLLSSFDSEPEAPHVQLPIVIE